MEFAFIALLSPLLLNITVHAAAYFSIRHLNNSGKKPLKGYPFVSILVAARNEESNIISCLQSLHKLDYPPEKMEVLIGNDHSEDETERLVREFTEGKPEFSIFNISGSTGKARGKANVLAQLSRLSKGEYLFITDADIEVAPEWISSLLSHFDKETAIVSGTTMVAPKGKFSQMESMDWLYNMGLIKSFAGFGIPCTAIGNNMAIRRDAYFETGGYENIDFSVTEDYKLFEAVLKNNHGWKNVMEKENLNLSKPQLKIKNLLRQRKRWIKGAMELPVFWKFLFALFGLFYPLLFILLFIDIKAGIVIWLAKTITQAFYISSLYSRIEKKSPSILSHLFFELYLICQLIIVPVYYFLPGKVIWKGRTY